MKCTKCKLSSCNGQKYLCPFCNHTTVCQYESRAHLLFKHNQMSRNNKRKWDGECEGETSEGETSEGPQRKEHKSRDRGRDLNRRRHRSPPPPPKCFTPFERVRTRTSFDNILKTFDYEYHGPPDILRLLTKLKPFLKKKLENKFKENGPHKFFFALHSTFTGSSGDEFTNIFRRYKKIYFQKFYYYYVTVEPIDIYLRKILTKLGRLQRMPSWGILMNL